MSRYRIVCTDQEPVTQPTTHAHIIAVGTGTDPNKADKRWTLNEVLAAMNNSDVFYTEGETSGKTALVEKYVCSLCKRTWIRSTPDAVKDNNLDYLRRCSWS
jgi:ABC-type antimicrobial peptide transport system ATPase subunit